MGFNKTNELAYSISSRGQVDDHTPLVGSKVYVKLFLCFFLLILRVGKLVSQGYFDRTEDVSE